MGEANALNSCQVQPSGSRRGEDLSIFGWGKIAWSFYCKWPDPRGKASLTTTYFCSLHTHAAYIQFLRWGVSTCSKVSTSFTYKYSFVWGVAQSIRSRISSHLPHSSPFFPYDVAALGPSEHPWSQLVSSPPSIGVRIAGEAQSPKISRLSFPSWPWDDARGYTIHGNLHIGLRMMEISPTSIDDFPLSQM